MSYSDFTFKSSPTIEEIRHSLAHTLHFVRRDDYSANQSLLDQCSFKLDQASTQLDYGCMEKSVIAVLMNVPVLPTNNSKKNSQHTFKETGTLYNENILLFHAYIREIAVSIMFVKGCPLKTGLLSEILSRDELADLVKFIAWNFKPLFYIVLDSTPFLLNNSRLVIEATLQKYFLDITRQLSRTHLQKLFQKIVPQKFQSKPYPPTIIQTHLVKLIKSHGIESPFIGPSTGITFTREIDFKKCNYIYIEQPGGFPHRPRDELKTKPLKDIYPNLSQVDIIHEDIVKLLTKLDIVPFKRINSNQIVKPVILPTNSAGPYEDDFKFIAELTELQMINDIGL